MNYVKRIRKLKKAKQRGLVSLKEYNHMALEAACRSFQIRKTTWAQLAKIAAAI